MKETSTTTITNETIIITINKKTLESSKVNSNENETSKLNSVWNKYDKRLKGIDIN